jgi:hypothetical protein
MQFTRIPALAHSTLSEAQRWRTAALAALYGLECHRVSLVRFPRRGGEG